MNLGRPRRGVPDPDHRDPAERRDRVRRDHRPRRSDRGRSLRRVARARLDQVAPRAGVAAIIAAALALLTAVPANAAQAVDIPIPSAPESTQSIPLTDMECVFPIAGGWDNRNYGSQGVNGSTAPATAFRLSEPCVDSGSFGFAVDVSTQDPAVGASVGNVCVQGTETCFPLEARASNVGGNWYAAWCVLGTGSYSFWYSTNGGVSWGGGAGNASYGICHSEPSWKVDSDNNPKGSESEAIAALQTYDCFILTTSGSPSVDCSGAGGGGGGNTAALDSGVDENSADVYCLDAGNVGHHYNLPIPLALGSTPLLDDGETYVRLDPQALGSSSILSTCRRFVSLQLVLITYDIGGFPIYTLGTWRYLGPTPPAYPDGGGDLHDDVFCILFPGTPGCFDDPEADITCDMNYSDPGNPITVIGEFFQQLPGWAACMVVPVGWDRGALIQKAWGQGPIASFSDGVSEALPPGFSCGVVATIPLPGGDPVVLNTCSMDVAPDWVKTVAGAVLIIGIAALCVKRIMWAVGSKG